MNFSFLSNLSKKQTIILTCGAVLLFSGSILLLQGNRTKSASNPAVPTPIPLTSNISPVSDLRSAIVSLRQSSPTSVTVDLDTGGAEITGVQLELSYNPQVLQNVTVSPGKFFDNPLVLSSNINTTDTTHAILLYAITDRYNNRIHGKGVIATIFYTSNPGIANTTSLTFLPRTKVTMRGVGGQSTLKQAIGITLDVSH